MYKTQTHQIKPNLLNQHSRHPQAQSLVTVGKTAVVTNRPTQPLIIDATSSPSQTHRLSHFLRKGAKKHPLCRNSFVKKVTTGFYQYERRIHFATCAIAAAFVGAFGTESLQDAQFSYSMAIWKLNQQLGYDLQTTYVTGPTGRENPLAKEMMELVDINWWTREGVADWLESLGL